MNLADKKYTDLISRFDNWYDMFSIVTTMKHIGLDTDISEEDYLKEIKFLVTAKTQHPDLPLNEAYIKAKEVGEIIIPWEQRPSRGLGDTIYKITHATGLDKLATLYTKITGKPCGCGERQEALNKLLPYGVTEDGV